MENESGNFKMQKCYNIFQLFALIIFLCKLIELRESLGLIIMRCKVSGIRSLHKLFSILVRVGRGIKRVTFFPI